MAVENLELMAVENLESQLAMLRHRATSSGFYGPGPRRAMAGLQPRYETGLNGEEYVKAEAWREARLDRCPRRWFLSGRFRRCPANVKGIEINAHAAELARVSVWIGEIQWMRRNGFNESRDPILKPLDTIECRDAILAPDGSEPD